VQITPFFDDNTATFSYIIHDPSTGDAVIIDPVLDYEPLSATIFEDSMDILKKFIAEQKLKVRLILDTHMHADHMTASYFLKEFFHTKNAIGSGFLPSQAYFSHVYGTIPNDYRPAYDHYLKHQESTQAGSIRIQALAVPGHTPSCSAYIIGENVFSGDAIFLPALGCGRADFPGGNAKTLYQSIQNQLYTLPDHFKMWVGHDYPAEGQPPQAFSTIGESKASNRLIKKSTSLEEFVEAREKKDRTLAPPRLLLPSMQVNILGGQLPHADQEGRRYLRLPLSVKESLISPTNGPSQNRC
jgi:glyoxylase-like metal-dependent hydrolase (beta-lactamase superfamily II)